MAYIKYILKQGEIEKLLFEHETDVVPLSDPLTSTHSSGLGLPTSTDINAFNEVKINKVNYGINHIEYEPQEKGTHVKVYLEELERRS